MYEQIDFLGIKFNDYCNLNCKYCFETNNSRSSHSVFNKGKELVEFLKSLNMNACYICSTDKDEIKNIESLIDAEKYSDARTALEKMQERPGSDANPELSKIEATLSFYEN